MNWRTKFKKKKKKVHRAAGEQHVMPIIGGDSNGIWHLEAYKFGIAVRKKNKMAPANLAGAMPYEGVGHKQINKWTDRVK